MSKRIDISHTLPIWSISQDLIKRSESIIIFGPRFSGKSSLLRKLIRDGGTTLGRRSVVLELALAISGGEIDYTKLLSVFIRGGGFGVVPIRKRSKIRDRNEFVGAIGALLDAAGDKMIVGLRLAERGVDEEQYDLLKSFHVLLGGNYFNGNNNLTLVVVDSYSIWFHRALLSLESELYSFQEEHWRALTLSDIERCIRVLVGERRLSALPEDALHGVALKLKSATGGHTGLLRESIEALDEVGWRPGRMFWKEELPRRLGNGRVLQRLRYSLSEEPKGLAETAIEYEEPAFPVELRSSRMRLLLQLGVLQWRSNTEVELCPGAISELMRATHKAVDSDENDRLSRLGTVISETWPTAYEPATLELSDDDIVIVHISDLHVSDRYAFRFSIGRGEYKNSDKPTLGELLASDLVRLNLLGRVDCLAVTGDFVWSGNDVEFRRAKQVLDEIIDSMKLDQNKIHIIPGNHDLDWANSPLASPDPFGRGDREAFLDFAERLGFDLKDGFVCRQFQSRSCKRVLRLIGLDSNYVEGKLAPGIGYVAREALDGAAKWLSQAREPKPDEDHPKEEIIWLCLHHHIFPATSVRFGDALQAKISATANSVEVLTRAVQWGVEAILHGHEHQPSITVARRWPTDFLGRAFFPITSIGVGSIGVETPLLGPFARHHYYVLILRKGDLLVRSRCLGGGGVAFVSHEDILIPRGR